MWLCLRARITASRLDETKDCENLANAVNQLNFMVQTAPPRRYTTTDRPRGLMPPCRHRTLLKGTRICLTPIATYPLAR